MAVRDIEIYILISGFLALLEVKELGKVLILIFAWWVQTISGLDSQSKFQMLTLFSTRHVGVLYGGTSTWRLQTGLCSFDKYLKFGKTYRRNDLFIYFL